MKRFALALLWVVASVGAVSVAWAGVNVVSTEVISPPLATLAPSALVASASDVEGAAATPEQSEGVEVDDGSESEATTTSTTVDPPTSLADTVAPDAAPPLDTAGGSDPGTTQSQPTTTTTTVGVTPTEAPASPTTTVAPAETATFALEGGSVAVSFSATEVVILWATAHPGFDVTIEPETPGWKIEFRSNTHRSRVDVWWKDGAMHRVEERAA